jgi:hypothetical protein
MPTIEDCVRLLNNLLEYDYEATYKLIETRHSISKQLEDSDVNVMCAVEDDVYTLGMLGVLQGLFGTNKERIASVFSEDGKLLRFEVLDK